MVVLRLLRRTLSIPTIRDPVVNAQNCTALFADSGAARAAMQRKRTCEGRPLGGGEATSSCGDSSWARTSVQTATIGVVACPSLTQSGYQARMGATWLAPPPRAPSCRETPQVMLNGVDNRRRGGSPAWQ
jgi:hypothetical protein